MSDYIDRTALLSFLRREANEAQIYADENGGESVGYAECLEDVIADIERIPAANVEPVRHGEWVDCGDEYGSYARCSVCGAEYTNWDADCARTDFCPNCGAKMDGGNNDETD